MFGLFIKNLTLVEPFWLKDLHDQELLLLYVCPKDIKYHSINIIKPISKWMGDMPYADYFQILYELIKEKIIPGSRLSIVHLSIDKLAF